MIHFGGFSEQTTSDGICFVVCDALCASGVADHLFSTRCGGVSTGAYASMNLTTSTGDAPGVVAENLRRLLPLIGADGERVCRTHQIHEDQILPVGAENAALFVENPPACDGLMTDESGIVLMGQFADCVPILLCDPVRRVCAVVHAGWRGTVRRIAERAADAMRVRYGCHPADCMAAVGPSIGPCCFLTHDDVAAAVRALDGVPPDEVMTPAPDGRMHVDLKRINAQLLNCAGIGKVFVSTACTCCTPERYFSHRRDGRARGGMAALIRLRRQDD